MPSAGRSRQALPRLRAHAGELPTAFYRSPLADNNRVEQWQAEGAKDMAQRANALWRGQLEQYEAPAIDPAVDEALLDYIQRRKASFPDSNV